MNEIEHGSYREEARDIAVDRKSLQSNWKLRELSRHSFPEHRHVPAAPATVPGSVHLDLMRAGVIPDPFQRMFERTVEWVDEADWQYETRFDVADISRGKRYLEFLGLDTMAEITLNGIEIGRTDNMYIPHRFDVDGFLKLGENILQVVFRSALRTGRERRTAFEQTYGVQMPEEWDRWSDRSFVRKAQYMYGWDWGPVLVGAGIWREVELVTVAAAEIVDWNYTYDLDGDSATVTLSANISNAADGFPLKLRASVVVDGNRVAVETSVPSGAGLHTVFLPALKLDVQRWRTNGVGSAILYAANVALIDVDGADVDSRSAKVGFRTLELLREPDVDGGGEGFIFQVNGEKLYIKGANWIPDSSYPGAITAEQVRRRLMQARDAGFNMVRIWGGGFYESDIFYETCDELGLLVWQDFPYACAYYPDIDEYAAAARLEATSAVRRIRVHPSIALWCGNNENHTMYHGVWGGVRPPRYLGENLYHDLLPRVVAAEDPKTPYWPSSPYGGDDPNSGDAGDCHNWDVWHGRGDWLHYTSNSSRFCSEFGFASSCGQKAWDGVLSPDDRAPRSAAVMWHEKTRKGYETYLGYVVEHFPAPVTLDDLVYYTQLNQAEALKYGIEHYRRIKGRCWGTLFWQFNDCWPVQSWSIIDSLGEQKAAYYFCKKFYAPLLLSLVKKDDAVEIHLVNDLLTGLAGVVTLKVMAFDGELLFTESFAAAVDGNTAALTRTVDLSRLVSQRESSLIHCEFATADGAAKAENILLFAEPKDIVETRLPETIAVEKIEDGRYSVTIKANGFTPYVWIAAPDHTPLDCSDNFFHMLPNEERKVTVKPIGGHSSDGGGIELVLRSLRSL